MHPIPPQHNEHEEATEEDVAEVAVEVVEVGDHAQWVGAEEVVEAQVLGSSNSIGLKIFNCPKIQIPEDTFIKGL